MKCKNKAGLVNCGEYCDVNEKIIYCSKCHNERFLNANPKIKEFRKGNCKLKMIDMRTGKDRGSLQK